MTIAENPLPMPGSEGRLRNCINEALTDDNLRAILSKMDTQKDKEVFGFVCKRWLNLQSTERRKLRARAGPLMLQKMAVRFSALNELDLSQSSSRSFFPGVTDSDLSVIANGFTILRVLVLQNCKGITDAGLKSLGNSLLGLQSLNISQCRKVTDKGVSAVASGCINLRSLYLAGCRSITDQSLKSLSENCRYLEELCLQGCTNITDSGVSTLVSGCKHIILLDLNKCSNIGNDGITTVSKCCSSSLKTLRMQDCYKVGDESILFLAKYCNNLETLILGGCRDITNDAIKSLARSCQRSLKNLGMDWCLNIGDSSISYVLCHCENLEALDIGCCDEVSDAAFAGLSSKDVIRPFKVLKMSNCPKITVVGISAVVASCKNLEYLDVRSCPHVTKVVCDEAGVQFPGNCKVNFNGSLTEPDVLL